MKKYVKPDLYFESFTLSHSVASGCSPALNFQLGACSLDSSDLPGLPEGVYLFTGDNGPCNVDSSVYEDYCYQTGSDSYNVFTS